MNLTLRSPLAASPAVRSAALALFLGTLLHNTGCTKSGASDAGSGGAGGASHASSSSASSSTGGAATSTSSASGTGGSAASTTASSSSGSTPPGPGYYVSPGGSDASDGLSPSTPFKTLEKAQTSMRASSTLKTTYLMTGTFARTAVLALTSADSGESWLAAPSATPVLDGGGTVAEAFTVSGSSITLRWLTLQNFASIGILGEGGSQLLIDSNTIQNILCTGFNQGGVVILGSAADVTISHNLVKKSNYSGIMAANSAGDTRSNLHIESNAIYDVCLTVADCGGLYADDRNHSATGTLITHNIVGNYGPVANQTKAIYLDDEESNVTVENNIVYGTGQWALQVHGGDHDVFQNNVFDISAAAQLGLYQYDGPTASNYGMAGNVFSCNIVYSSSAPPSSLWTYSVVSADVPPAVSKNLYWDAKGAFSNSGSIVDSSPTVANPGFVDPATSNYAFASAPPSFCAAFVPIDTSGVGPLPNL